MTLEVRTLTAATKAALAVLVQREIARGWQPIGNPAPLLVGGKQEQGRAAWAQILRRG